MAGGRRTRWAWLAPVAVAVATACGGGGGGSPEARSTSTAVAPATTTTVHIADPAGADLASKGVVVSGDLPHTWVEHAAGAGPTAAGPSCMSRPGGPLERLPSGNRHAGPVHRYDGASLYITTTAFAFADEADARAATGIVRDPAYGECVRKDREQQDRSAPDAAEGATWRLARQPHNDAFLGQGGFEAYVALQFQAIVDGQLVDANGFVLIGAYRVGRVVVVAVTESRTEEDDPPDLDQQAGRDLQAALTRVYARLGDAQPG